MTSSEVIEPLGVGLEFEVFIDRAGSYSKPCTLSTVPDFQNPRAHLQQEGQGRLRTKILAQSTGKLLADFPSWSIRLTSIKQIHEGWAHDPCWNCMNAVCQCAIYRRPSISLIFTFSHSFYASIYPSIFDLLNTYCIQTQLHKNVWLFLVPGQIVTWRASGDDLTHLEVGLKGRSLSA